MILQHHSWAYIWKKTIIWKDIWMAMFILVLLTIAKMWKQLKCPLIDERIMKSWYIYTMEYFPIIKKEWNNTICSNIDRPKDDHTKWNKPQRERQIWYDVTYTWNLKKRYNGFTYKNRNIPTDLETKPMAIKVKWSHSVMSDSLRSCGL